MLQIFGACCQTEATFKSLYFLQIQNVEKAKSFGTYVHLDPKFETLHFCYYFCVEDVIIFSVEDVIIFEVLDVIILECWGCYHFIV